MIAKLRHWAARSTHPAARALRALRKRWSTFTLPAPRLIVVPWLYLFLFLRAIVFFVRRRFFAEPLLKAYCTKHGRGVTAGIYVPWVKGRGELLLGDYVRLNGKISIAFAASFVPNPRLSIGDYSDIGHNTSFVVGREITIGRHVQIASEVSFRDSSGHASDPAKRLAGAPPDPSEIKPIVVHDNVWIGAGAMILPGAEIGEGSIIVARSIVSGTVAPNTVVAGSPARRVGTLTPASAAAPPETSTEPSTAADSGETGQ
ncbi:MAG: acyltransferase [Xanthomonadales bacterium]|nr:acyltransferase [Xanthomonadales bacterium]MCB1578071.1 acyltransferase [Xanthomonadales bacterium]